jgi:arginyl-tRNA synthetase
VDGKLKSVVTLLESRVSAALKKAVGHDCPAIVIPSKSPQFGDYQANGVMAAAKQIKANPRQLAEKVVESLAIDDLCEKPEIAGPGFINLRLKTSLLEKRLLGMFADNERLGIDPASTPQTVVVDYSGPNIAKQMHVGHLRSTIIGDCICRMLEFEGHNVIRQNHIGDWGTQFGMLIAYIEKRSQLALEGKITGVMPNTLSEFETFYIEAKKLFDTDENFQKRSRDAVVGLHTGDKTWLGRWQLLICQSKKHYQELYHQLNITLKENDVRGESAYNDLLPTVVKELKEKGLAVESEGAVCVFPKGFVNKEGAPLPFIIQKSDGAFLYATTDLAALRFRIGELKADKIIYVTDARQALHFQMLFATAQVAGWTDRRVELVHVTFGTMLGADGRPFKTREGGTVKLKDLLEEAVEKARAVVEEKNPELPAEKKARIASAVGIGAVKYADYSNNRDSDYIFSFEKMLAMDGNTAPYMQYAYARIRSIERKSAGKEVDIERELAGITTLALTDPAEVDLAKKLIQYDQAIEAAAGQCRPNHLTSYLYDLSQAFSRFYNACPVLQASAEQRPTRLLLCDLTARIIRHGLGDLLGIETPEQM